MTTVRDSIDANLKMFMQSLNDGDAAGVARHYTVDAAVLPPDSTRIDGRAGIQGVWQSVIDADVRDITLTTLEVDVFGDVANEVGAINATVPSEGGGRVQWVGKYVAVWKRERDDTWRMHRDIWNFDT